MASSSGLELVGLLSALVFTAFVVEAAAGFGGMVVSLTLGALWFPVEQLLGWLVPVNLVLSAYLLARGLRVVEWRFLAVRALPWMALGLVAGTALTQVMDAAALKPLFGGFVVVAALSQLLSAKAQQRALSAPVRVVGLVSAGAVHGLFATGGPLAVLVFNRELPHKAAFRATLSALWVVLNALVLPRLAHDGVLTAGTLAVSAGTLPALAVGIAAGEWLHHRLDEQRFRRMVSVVLAAAGAVLVASSLLSRS